MAIPFNQLGWGSLSQVLVPWWLHLVIFMPGTAGRGEGERL